MNSYYDSGSFGAPNSQNRKQIVYNQSPVHNFTMFNRKQKKEGVKTTSQQQLEAKVGTNGPLSQN